MGNRRIFLKNIGVTAAGCMLAQKAEGVSLAGSKKWNRQRMTLGNGIELELIFDGRYCLGIGRVSCNGLLLRSGELPMFVQIRTPDAVDLINYRLVEKQITDSGISLRFSMQKKEGGLMEWMLHTVRNRRNMRDWLDESKELAETSLQLEIKPVERDLDGESALGFSYKYSYKSNDLPIYKITDRASWEIDGSALGCEFWMRNGVVDSIIEFKRHNDFYSTEWYLPHIANPNIFQFHPLQTHLQGFTFTAARAGALVTWPTRVAHVRSLFEKWRDRSELLHFHEHCGDLQFEFSTVPVEVLWFPGEREYVERANLYHRLREMVHETLHQQIGMRRERITTYGVIEEWTEPDIEIYRSRILPQLLDAGVKTVMIPNECQNVMNTWGLSNMCCNVDYKISATVGEEKLRSFCNTVKAAGARVEMWGNTALSTTTELYSHRDGREKGIKFLPYQGSIMEVIDQAEAPWVRNPSNAIEADHYTPRFCALNLRDPDIRSYWMKQWKYFHNEIGIEGIFLDSSFNMSSDKFHFQQWSPDQKEPGLMSAQKDMPAKYRPEYEAPGLIQTQYYAHLEWVVEMQRMGYYYCGEDLGVFGINRTGPKITDRVNSLSIWADSYCDFDNAALLGAGLDPFDIFFKGLAYRMMWKVYWDFNREKLNLGIDDPRAFMLLKVFNEVADSMRQRHILPQEHAVIYSGGVANILWSFADFKYEIGQEMLIDDLVDRQQHRCHNLQMQKHHVYTISPLASGIIKP